MLFKEKRLIYLTVLEVQGHSTVIDFALVRQSDEFHAQKRNSGLGLCLLITTYPLGELIHSA